MLRNAQKAGVIAGECGFIEAKKRFHNEWFQKSKQCISSKNDRQITKQWNNLLGITILKF